MFEEWLSQGVIVYAVCSIVSVVIGWILRSLWAFFRKTPARNVLGELSNECKVLLRWMQQPASSTNVYESSWPDPRSPQTVTQTTHQNIPNVLAASDVTAAMDAIAVLGRYRNIQRVEIASANQELDVWDCHLICVGGTEQAFTIVEQADKGELRFDRRCFSVANIQTPLIACRHNATGEEVDFGLVLKSLHRQTGRTFWVIMGTGVLGTEGAAYYLKTNITKLGKLFGHREFAVIIACSGTGGRKSAEPYWYYPDPLWWRKIVHFLIWKELREKVARKKVIPPSLRHLYGPTASLP